MIEMTKALLWMRHIIQMTVRNRPSWLPAALSLWNFVCWIRWLVMQLMIRGHGHRRGVRRIGRREGRIRLHPEVICMLIGGDDRAPIVLSIPMIPMCLVGKFKASCKGRWRENQSLSVGTNGSMSTYLHYPVETWRHRLKS